jgi:hypothetical protein
LAGSSIAPWRSRISFVVVSRKTLTKSGAATLLGQLMQRIIAAPAETLEGLKVKARVVYWCKCGEIDEHDDGTRDMRAAFSIIKDLARLQGLLPISSLEYEGRYIKPLH